MTRAMRECTITSGIWRPHSCIGLALSIGASGLAAGDSSDGKLSDADHFFLEEVQPLLASRCLTCHGPDKAEGGLRLDSREAALKGGDSGPALVPGKPNESLLLMAVKRTHKVLEMPPKDKLSGKRHRRARTLDTRRRAVAGSAAGDQQSRLRRTGEHIGDAWSDPRNPIVRLFGGQRLDLWSLKPVKRPDVPTAKHSDWAKSDLDRFVLARFEQDHVSPPAIGRSAHACAAIVLRPDRSAADAGAGRRLRAIRAANGCRPRRSPRSSINCSTARASANTSRGCGSTSSATATATASIGTSFARRPGVSAITSSARSTPTSRFDQFIREQLAGDELFDGPPTTPAEQDCLIATGYLRLGPHDNAAKLFDEQDRSRAELLADVTETTAGAFLGLTLTLLPLSRPQIRSDLAGRPLPLPRVLRGDAVRRRRAARSGRRAGGDQRAQRAA